MPLVRLEDDELEVLRQYRRKKREDARLADLNKPATAALMSLREWPRYKRNSGPWAYTALDQVKNALEVILYGIRTIEGEKIQLPPVHRDVLLLHLGLKLELLEMVGPPDPENVGGVLGYKPRRIRDAHRDLTDWGLIHEPEREYGRIVKIQLTQEIMGVPDRAARAGRELASYPQGHSRWELDQRKRQKIAGLLSSGELCDDPCVSPRAAPAAAPPPLPQTPTTTGKGNAPPGPTAAPAPLTAEPILILNATNLLHEARPIDLRPRHTRPRKQGANDHSRDRRSSGVWRSLLEFVGLAPPS